MAVQISGNDITVPRDGTFNRNVSIAGTLTYEDVTNVDSIGIVTARNGIEIGARPGVAASISVDGNMIVSGISTFGGNVSVEGTVGSTGNITITNTEPTLNLTDSNDNSDFAVRNNDGAFGIRDTTNGVERLSVKSSGKVLVNTTTESSVGNSTYSFFEVSGNTSTSDGPGHFTLKRGETSASMSDGDTISRLIFSSLDGGDYAYIQSSVDGSPSGSDYPGTLQFYTCADGASSATERLRITPAGRVSVGNNASPDGPLHVYQSSAGSVTADTSANLAVFESGETNNGITLLSPNTGKSNIYFGTTGTGGSYEAGIRYTHESHGTTADRRAMHFRVGGGERARIQNGRLLVGRTNNISVGGDASDHCFEQITDNGYALTVHCNTANQRGIGLYYPDNSNTPQAAFAFQIGNNFKTIIRDDGDLENANNNYGSISDISLKENIVDANSQWDDIKNIKIRNYNFKESTGQQTHKQIGVIAQELETVCPNLVDVTRETGKKNVAYSVLYMKSVKALQEAMARIETLEAKVAALEGS